MTGKIIENGIQDIAPAIEKVNTIGLEMVNYVGYIGIAVLGILIMYYAIKTIIRRIQDEVLYKTRNKRKKASRNMKNRRRYKKRQNEDNDLF